MTPPVSRALAPGILVVENLLSTEECASFRAFADGHGYDEAPVNTTFGDRVRKDIRNNERAMIDDAMRAMFLWERVAAHCFKVEGRTAIGVNERLRFYRYQRGQRFGWHADGAYETPDGTQRSAVTFMIYLNEGYGGGQTRIDVGDHLKIVEQLFRPGEEPIIDVTPKVGMALLFVHHMRHTGAEVTSGTKYVVRSDIMYPLQK